LAGKFGRFLEGPVLEGFIPKGVKQNGREGFPKRLRKVWRRRKGSLKDWGILNVGLKN